MEKKTKLVTSYYAYHWDKPFWGQQGRERWYKYSIACICNMGVEVVCYTDDRMGGLDELTKLKEERNLTNLTIKNYPLENNPWHDIENEIRDNHSEIYDNPDVIHLYRRSSQIYWTKFKFLELELEPDINLYWIDGGLAHEGLFPKHLSSWGDDEEAWKNRFVDEGLNIQDIESRYYTYDRAFTPAKMEEINKWNDNKIINIGRNGATDNDINVFKDKVKDAISIQSIFYPVAAIFGGNSNLMLEYINYCYEAINKSLESKDYLCLEQEIMWYVNAKHPDLFKNWSFYTFYHEDWDFYNLEEYGVPLSHFFAKPLN